MGATRRTLTIGLTALAAVCVGAGSAEAEPPGYWQGQAATLPSATSDVGFPSLPIQVDNVVTSVEGGTTVTRVTPYLAPWAHDLVPIDHNAVVDLTGAIHLSAFDRSFEIAGHCIFAGEDTSTGDTHQIESSTLQLGDETNSIRIAPELHVR